MLSANILVRFSTGKLRTLLNKKVRRGYYLETNLFKYLACKKNFYGFPSYRNFVIKILSNTPKRNPSGNISFNFFCADFSNFIINTCNNGQDKLLNNSFLLACSNMPFDEICESWNSYTIFHYKCQAILSSFYKAKYLSFEQFSIEELKNQIDVFKSFHPLYKDKEWEKREYSNEDSTVFVYSAIYIFCNACMHFTPSVCDILTNMFIDLEEYHDEYKINDQLDEEKLWSIFLNVFDNLI